MKKNYLITLILALAVAFTLSSCGDKIETPLPEYNGERLTVELYFIPNLDLVFAGTGTVTVKLDGYQSESFEFQFDNAETSRTSLKVPYNATVTVEYSTDLKFFKVFGWKTPQGSEPYEWKYSQINENTISFVTDESKYVYYGVGFRIKQD